MDVWTASFATIAALLYIWYHKRKIRSLEESGIPMITSLPIIGSLHKLFGEGLIQSERAWLNKHGNVVGWYNGYILNVVTTDRDIISEIMVKKFNIFANRWVLDIFPDPLDKGVSFLRGKDWKRVRSMLPAVFIQSKIKKMTSSVNNCAASVTSELEMAATTDDIIAPKSFFSTYALRVVCSCAFGINLDDDKKKREDFYSYCRQMFSNKLNVCLILGVIIPHADKLLKLCDVSPFPKKTVKFIAGETTKLIDERRKNPELRRDDFLQLLTDVSSGTNGHKKDLSTEEVNAQAFSFMIGTYETTAACLHYAAYELALNQHIQDKLKKEILTVVGDAEPTYEHLIDLKYTDYVIKETLRKYPTVARLSRQCSESTTIKGVRFPKGSIAVIPIYHLHHDPQLYPDPEEFRPERFDPESECKIDPVLYLPFGGGPRMCIGIRFAMMEMKLLLVHALRKVRFVPCTETEPSPPQFLKSTPVLQTVKPIKLKVVLDPLK